MEGQLVGIHIRQITRGMEHEMWRVRERKEEIRVELRDSDGESEWRTEEVDEYS